jgi:glyoxylase-like metal-dependent hydrolase (beta-lactamase superfamily II)
MRVHHLSCGTFCPPAKKLINGTGGLMDSGHLTCHCLLVETSNGLVLVDTGLGTRDLEDPKGQIGATWITLMRPDNDPLLAAVRQIEALGFYADDVRHIVLTHLDFDHAGGLPDFPQAEVHVFEDEYQAAMHPRGPKERFRYKPQHFAHNPAWVRYGVEGDRWFGFDAVRALGDTETDILLVPLTGHTRGHCGVAVREGNTWLLHCGDAYFSHHELTDPERHCPPGTKGYERMMQTDRSLRVANQIRLQELLHAHGSEVRTICSHDPAEFEAYKAPARGAARRRPERTT